MGLIGTIFSKQINAEISKYVSGLALYQENLFRWIGKDYPIFEAESFDYIQNGYMSVGAVYECVDLISKKIAACPRIVYEITDTEKYKKYKSLIKGNKIESLQEAMLLKAQSMQEVNVPRIEKLLTDPNPLQTGDEFFTSIASYYLIRGNTYMYGNGADNENKIWNEIFALPNMHILSGGTFEPIKAYFLNWQSQAEQRFEASQVAHMKTFNPDYSVVGTQLYGMPPLRAYAMSLQRSKLSNKEANRQVLNGGTFGLLTPKNKEDQLGKDQKDALKEQMVVSKDSDNRLDRFKIGNIPMEWLEMGLTAQDLELFKSMQFTDEDVYRCFHVPPQYRSTDSSTFNNQADADRKFIYNAVAPIADKISDTLTRFICRPYEDLKNSQGKKSGKKYVIQLDYTSLPELAKDMKAVMEWLDKAWILTPNEKREVIGWGKSTEQGMDMIWIPSGLKPIQDAAISPEEFNRAFNELNQSLNQ